MNPSSTAELELRKADLWFGGTHALSEVDLIIRPGELVGLIGPNGAGKSSLLNSISGFYRVTSGTVTYGGASLVGMSPTGAAELGIARTFQSVEVLREESVLENVMLGRHRHGRAGLFSSMLYWGRAAKEEARSRHHVERVLDMLGLVRYRNHEAGELTWAQQKIVEIARAVVSEPSLLLLDEPTSGMSVEEKGFIADVIRRLKAELDLTIVVIEHDVQFIGSLCHRVVVLDFGEVIADGPTAEVLRDERVVAAYLGRHSLRDSARSTAG